MYDVVVNHQVEAMTTYNIDLENDILRVKFGDPAQNDQIVQDAAMRLEEMGRS